MQLCVIEFCRNVIGWKDAHSVEMNKKTSHPVIDIMESQKEIKIKGGTMRLGAYSCELDKNSKAYKAYKSSTISERHRHRFEFNNQYLDEIKSHGLIPTGINKETGLVEVVELTDHPFFIGVQYHPELKSTPENPHPLFMAFVEAAIGKK